MKLQKTYQGEVYAVNADVETITPTQARAYLDTGKLNRKETNVDRYAYDMKAGRWFLTGQPIIFNDKGDLVDGFNRCHACIKADTPFLALVVRDVSAKSFHVIDTGKTRSLVDFLTMKGDTEYVSIVGYIVKRIVCLEEGRPVASSTPTTRSEEIAALKKHPEIEEAARYAHGRLGRFQPSLMAFLYWYYIYNLKNTKAKTFFHDYANVVAHQDLSKSEESSYVKGTAPFAEKLFNFFNGRSGSHRPVKVTKLEALLKAVGAIEAYLADENPSHTIKYWTPDAVEFKSTGLSLTRSGTTLD